MYLYQIFCRSGSGEHALHVMFEHGLFTDNSIIDHIDDLKAQGIEVSFYYGSRDWMDTDFNDKKISEILIERGEKVFIIDNSDHRLYFDNPDELVQSLNIDLLPIIQERSTDNHITVETEIAENMMERSNLINNRIDL